MKRHGSQGRAIVMGILERGGELRAGVAGDGTAASLETAVYAHVKEGATS